MDDDLQDKIKADLEIQAEYLGYTLDEYIAILKNDFPRARSEIKKRSAMVLPFPDLTGPDQGDKHGR
jgi:hypothetical protein